MKKALVLLSLLFVAIGGAYHYQKTKTPQSLLELLAQKKNIAGFQFPQQFHTEYAIINYWASWCPPCIAETPSLIKFVDANSDMYRLFAISQDSSLKDIENFLKTFPTFRNKNAEIIWDDNRELARKMAVEQLPETFIFSYKKNKFLKISGSTNWEDPELKKYIDNYFLN